MRITVGPSPIEPSSHGIAPPSGWDSGVPFPLAQRRHHRRLAAGPAFGCIANLEGNQPGVHQPPERPILQFLWKLVTDARIDCRRHGGRSPIATFPSQRPPNKRIAATGLSTPRLRTVSTDKARPPGEGFRFAIRSVGFMGRVPLCRPSRVT